MAAQISPENGGAEVEDVDGDGKATEGRDAEMGGELESEHRSLKVAAVDVDMSDAVQLVQVGEPANGADTVVSALGDLSGVDDTTVVPMSEGGLPLPPAAPTNGNLSSVVGSKHKKSVSFIMEAADAETLLRDGSAVGGPVDKVVPALPPVGQTLCDGVVDEDGAVSGNEAFLRRNFSLGDDLGQVRMLDFLYPAQGLRWPLPSNLRYRRVPLVRSESACQWYLVASRFRHRF